MIRLYGLTFLFSPETGQGETTIGKMAMAVGTVKVEMVGKGKRKQKSWQKKRELLYLESFHKEGKYIVV